MRLPCWVTLLWAGEAALLYRIGRADKVRFYVSLSYIMIYLAFASLLHDWSSLYLFTDNVKEVTPVFNINFLSSLLFIAAAGSMSKTAIVAENNSAAPNEFLNFISVSVTGILLITLYFSLRFEISGYWDQLYNNSLIEIPRTGGEDSIQLRNTDLSGFKTIWLINYSVLFFSALSFINIKKIKSRTWGIGTTLINTVVLIVFLTQGLYILSELRVSYLNQSEYFTSGAFNIGIRYISFIFAGLLLFTMKSSANEDFMPSVFKVFADVLISISLIWILSSELLSWMDILNSAQSYKLGLSILWGTCSLVLIVYGIWKKKKHLRIGAIILFALTLIKLFLYDISYLDTISKTIVFVTLGILLLIISFLYNKYKNLIS